jgi:hypothetical protein
MLGSANNQTTAEDGAMSSILQNEVIDKLPVAELQADLDRFLQRVLRLFWSKMHIRSSFVLMLARSGL